MSLSTPAFENGARKPVCLPADCEGVAAARRSASPSRLRALRLSLMPRTRPLFEMLVHASLGYAGG